MIYVKSIHFQNRSVRNEDLGEEEIPSTIPQMYNVAQWKPTNQSSEAHGGVSSRAVDNYVHEYGAEWNRLAFIGREFGLSTVVTSQTLPVLVKGAHPK